MGARIRVGDRHLPDQGRRARSDLRFGLREGREIRNGSEKLLFGPALGPRAPAASQEDVVCGSKGPRRERSLAGLFPGAALLPVAAFGDRHVSSSAGLSEADVADAELPRELSEGLGPDQLVELAAREIPGGRLLLVIQGSRHLVIDRAGNQTTPPPAPELTAPESQQA